MIDFIFAQKSSGWTDCGHPHQRLTDRTLTTFGVNETSSDPTSNKNTVHLFIIAYPNALESA